VKEEIIVIEETLKMTDIQITLEIKDMREITTTITEANARVVLKGPTVTDLMIVDNQTSIKTEKKPIMMNQIRSNKLTMTHKVKK